MFYYYFMLFIALVKVFSFLLFVKVFMEVYAGTSNKSSTKNAIILKAIINFYIYLSKPLARKKEIFNLSF